MPLRDVRLYHKNARKGNTDEIVKSLRRHGQYRSVVINKGTYTGRPMEVLCGNHTTMGARELGWETITADLVDVDDDLAKRIVLADNRLSDLGSYDMDLLGAELGTLDDLEGLGYTEADVAKLLAGDDEDPHDSGQEDDYESRYELVIECRDELHQEELFQKLQEEGLTVRVLSL